MNNVVATFYVHDKNTVGDLQKLCFILIFIFDGKRSLFWIGKWALYNLPQQHIVKIVGSFFGDLGHA